MTVFVGLAVLLFPPVAILLLILRRGGGVFDAGSLLLMTGSVVVFWFCIYSISGGDFVGMVGANFGVLFSLYPIMVLRFEILKSDYMVRVLGSAFSVLSGSCCGVGVGMYFSGGIFDACETMSAWLLAASVLYFVLQVVFSPMLTKKPFLFDGLVSDDGLEGEGARMLAMKSFMFIPVFLVLPFFVKILPNYLYVVMCMFN